MVSSIETGTPMAEKTFRLVEKLGSGLTADVYRAIDEVSGDEAAIKLMPLPPSSSVLQKNEQEALLACAGHANVIKVLAPWQLIEIERQDDGESGSKEVRTCMVQELAANGTLFELINTVRAAPLPMEACKTVIVQLLKAVLFLESKGFAHRDIKAENLALSDDYTVKMIDFGFAYKLANGAALDHVGTGCYQAPELVSEADAYDPLKSDIFAVGVTLYFLLTGRYPWVEASARDTYYNCFSRGRPVLFWRSRQRELQELVTFDESLQDLLNQMWHVDP